MIQKATPISAPLRQATPAWLLFSVEIAKHPPMDTSVDWVNGLAFSAGKPYSPVAAFGNQLSLFGESSSPKISEFENKLG